MPTTCPVGGFSGGRKLCAVDMTLISDGGGLGFMDAVLMALMLAPVVFTYVFLRRRADRRIRASSILRLNHR